MKCRSLRFDVAEKGKWSYVEYTLSCSELWQIAKAEIYSIIFGDCPAHYMSENLENLLCGYDQIRHRIVL